jgi:uncharacterized membrane protein YheB (UPF0754 family)
MGAVFGYFASRIAAKLMLRPTPQRQRQVVEAIGALVAAHLLGQDDPSRRLSQADLRRLISELLDEALGGQLQQFQSLPMVGSLLTDDRIRDLRDSCAASILTLANERLAAFPAEKLWAMVPQACGRELRIIGMLGAALGLVLGVCLCVCQAALLALLG